MTALLETEIRTERLLLRPLGRSDAPAIQVLVSDERVSRYTALIPHPYPENGAASFLAIALEKEGRGEARHFVLAFPDSPDTAIGLVGLTNNGDGTVSVGYWLGAPYWGRGLMSEAMASVTRFAILWRPEATPVAITHPDNIASQRVLERAGFRRSGTGTFDAPARDYGKVENAPIFVFDPADAA
jgi:RimJ/RimL family protein N-acetyltransferase